MGASKVVYKLERKNHIPEMGNKAVGLQALLRLGKRVPQTYVVSAHAWRRYQQGDKQLNQQIAAEISTILDPNSLYAIRSSANLEDSFDNSLAGLFTTVLNVQGYHDIQQAISAVWSSASTTMIQEHLLKRDLQSDQLWMAVLIQEMITPRYSGVVFSRNPITGARETVIEAVSGLGSQLVQDGITPDRWVYRRGEFREEPTSSLVPQGVITEIIRETGDLALRCKKDLDLEWVYDGNTIYWLQMREITALRNLPMYSNQISREMVAGLIKPMIWSVNIPLVNGAWIRLLTEVIGPNELEPHTLAKSFHYRSYFNMGLLGQIFERVGIPAESLEMMWGIAPKGASKFKYKPGLQAMRLLPSVLHFLWDKWSLNKRLPVELGALEAQYRQIDLTNVDRLSDAKLIEAIDQLFVSNQEVAYLNIVIPLWMYGFNTILRNQMKKINVEIANLDMQLSTAEFYPFNPVFRLEKLNQIFQKLTPDQQAFVRSATYEQVIRAEQMNEFSAGLVDLLGQFGHLSDNGNDFSSVPWRESPDMILKLVTNYELRTTSAAVEKMRFESIPMAFTKRQLIGRVYRQTRQMILQRERISYLYSFGYGLFRIYFMELGKRFARQGWIAQAEDIFYLDYDTACKLVEQGQPAHDLLKDIAGQKAAMDQAQHLTMPPIIYGDQPPPIQTSAVRKLIGTPTSSGYCTGRLKVVKGLQDFGKVKAGDVLAIPFSDVGWTPLFSSIAGVIAESGGILSHSSIIAREFGIPAVVSVFGSMQLQDGTLVTIDGYKGEVIIHEEEVNECA